MYHIIVNPAAGHGRSLSLLPALTTLFGKHRLEYKTLHTNAPLDAYNFARDAVAAGSKAIIAIGGDGTVQEVVAGMRRADAESTVIRTALGILPCGSGNDFALTLKSKSNKKIPPETEAEWLFDKIWQGSTRPVDLIDVNGTAFLNIGNIGLDARIVQNAVAFKKYFRRNAYLAAAYKSIMSHRNVPLRAEINGEVHEGAYTLIAVCNGQYYGGGLHIAPNARTDDGLITVCLVEGLSRPKAMVLFPTVMFEKHVALKAVRFFECETLTITLPETEVLCLDGNLYERSGVLRFAIMPGALRLFV